MSKLTESSVDKVISKPTTTEALYKLGQQSQKKPEQEDPSHPQQNSGSFTPRRVG